MKPVYTPYISKSDRPKGRAKQLKALGMKGNIWALREANELLSPSHFNFPNNRPNQKKIRKQQRSNPNA